KVSKESKNLLARLHAIWGLEQIGRRANRETYLSIQPIFVQVSKDQHPEVRAQAAKVLCERGRRGSDSTEIPHENVQRLAELLKDAEPRVRFFAAQQAELLRYSGFPFPNPRTVEHIKSIHAVKNALKNLVRDNNDQDPHLRHAGSRA